MIYAQVQIQNQNLTSFYQYLFTTRFIGEWKTQENNPFSYFDSTSGEDFVQFILFNDNTTALYILFFDPKYIDEKLVYGSINMTNYNISIKEWNGKQNMSLQKYYKQKDDGVNFTCPVEYNVQLKFDDDEIDMHQLQIKIKLESLEPTKSQCQFDMESNYIYKEISYYREILFYSNLLNIMCAIQYYCASRLIENLLNDDNLSNVKKISLFCVGFVTIYDTFLAFQNLNFAFMSSYFQYFILPAVFFFMLTMNCDMKLLWIVCRTRYQHHFFDPQTQRQFFKKFFIVYYFSVLTLFFLLYQYELYNSFLLVTAFFITPQIIHNFREGTNPKFFPEYIFGFLMINITVPLYFRGNPNNFRRLKPSWQFCVSWISIYIVQILILYIQYKFGPRKIIPKCLQPKQFNYYQECKSQELEDCAICLLHLMIEPDQQEQDLDRMLVGKILMITPCGHKFHPSCLKSWMEVKLSCPTCRHTIPPLCE